VPDIVGAVVPKFLREEADELDPPSPKPRTGAWFREHGGKTWYFGLMNDLGVMWGAVLFEWRHLAEWREVPIPDENGYCVKDGKLYRLVEVPPSHNTYHHIGSKSRWTVSIERDEIRRKEQEYGL
jgi:hypothetical protein